MSDWDFGRPSAGRFDVPRPSRLDGATYPYPLPFPLAQALDDDEVQPAAGQTRPAAPAPRAGGHQGIGRPPWETAAGTAPFPRPRVPEPAGLSGGAAGGPEGPGSRGRHRRDGRPWLIPAAVAMGTATVGAAAVLLTGAHGSVQHPGGAATPTSTARMTVRVAVKPSTSTSPSSSPTATAPLTLTQAQAVLARYTAVNNTANAERSTALLATVEAGSSYATDAGQYQAQQAVQAAPYPPFSPVQATYYLPAGEPAAGPRWFVVQVANAFKTSPSTVTSDEYLLFAQSTPGGAWQNVIEPYLLASATAPQIAVGADDLATPVSPDAVTVTVAPGQLPAVTAAALDGTQSGHATVADPGNLADRTDQRRWQRMLSGGSVTDAHMAATGADGQEFALLTTDGGALVFYSDAAEVTVTPPAGSVLRLTVPGFYSASQDLTGAKLSYLEQFAAYDPPAAAGTPPQVVADYSAITGRS
jgi:hypothetical protein